MEQIEETTGKIERTTNEMKMLKVIKTDNNVDQITEKRGKMDTLVKQEREGMSFPLKILVTRSCCYV